MTVASTATGTAGDDDALQILVDRFASMKRRYRKISQEGAVLWVNGKRVVIPHGSISAEETLLEFLRVRLQLSSCKLGCGEGGCGACTVMVSMLENGTLQHRAVNACMTPALAVHGTAITTAEGVPRTFSWRSTDEL